MALDCIPSLHLPPSSPLPPSSSLSSSSSLMFFKRERGRGRNGRVKWVGATSAKIRYIHFMHMIGGSKGWVEDNSLPTHYMQLSYWWMIRLSSWIVWWSLNSWISPNIQDLTIRVTSLVPRVNNLTSDDLVIVMWSLVGALTIVNFMLIRLMGRLVK